MVDHIRGGSFGSVWLGGREFTLKKDCRPEISGGDSSNIDTYGNGSLFEIIETGPVEITGIVAKFDFDNGDMEYVNNWKANGGGDITLDGPQGKTLQMTGNISETVKFNIGECDMSFDLKGTNLKRM